MKKILASLAMAALLFGAPASGAMPLAIKAFGGPEVKMTSLNSQNVYMVGIKGAAYLAEGYYMGAAGNISVSNVYVDASTPSDTTANNVAFNYYGLLIGNEILPMIEWYLLLGGGNVAITDTFSFTGGFTSGSTAFVGELGVNFVLGMTTIGVSYREVTGYSGTVVTKESLSGLSYNIGFKFGNMPVSTFKFK